MNFKYLLMLAVLIFGLAACGDDEEEEPMTTTCETTDITYTSNIAAILNSNCTTSGCHNDTDLANGFSVQTFPQAAAAALFDNFLPALNQVAGVSPMPRGADKLPQCDIDQIAAWIADGTPE